MKKKIVIILAVVVLGIGGVFGMTHLKNSQATSSTNEMEVEVTRVGQKEVTTIIDATGTVAFSDSISIYAKNSGKISSIAFKEGDVVTEGDVIINYDQTTLDSLKRQLQEAQLSLKSAQLSLEALYIPADDTQLIQLETQIMQTEKNIQDTKNNLEQYTQNTIKAQTDLQNAQILYNQGVISLAELRTYETTLENNQNQKASAENNLIVLEQQLESNKKQYESTKNKLNDATTQNRIESQKVAVQQEQIKVNQLQKDINDYGINITATQSGTITKMHVEEGESISEGKLVAQIGDLSDLVIEAYIPEYDMQGVEVGQKVKITSDATSEKFEGSILKVYPIAEKKTISGSEKNVVKIEVSIPANSGLKSGYSVKINVITNVEENALVIPTLSYMTETGEDPYVYVVKEDGTLEKRRIKIKSFENSVASVEGLLEGEMIVYSPDDTLYEGMQVVPFDNTRYSNVQDNNEYIASIIPAIKSNKKDLETL